MQGEAQILQGLNLCLRDQLTAINQLFLHARMAKDWGLRRFDGYEYARSIKAMKQADELIERILFLEGLPNLQDLGKLLIGENVGEMLNGDLTLLTGMRTCLVDTIKTCEDARDYVSRDLLEELLEETEEHIDWIETQQYLLANVGVENYLQAMMGEGE
ncbi:MAG: bacterioferritin [Gammaproteobacteria bacterium]|nr:bacterioferritin [Gammaproteobacteria bacterium]